MRKDDNRMIICSKFGKIVSVASVLVLLAIAPTFATKVETWKQESAASFAKGKRDRIVISDAGKTRLSRKPARDDKGLTARRVWDLARTADGTVFAATGDEGKIFRQEPGKPDWTLAYDALDSQVLALATLPNGHVFAGTGPTGQVIDVTEAGHPSSRPDPAVKYIWDLASDGDGNLYAATGPSGQLWKRSPSGAWSLTLDTRHTHLLSVAVGSGGDVYTGSDGEGLIYKVANNGKTTIVYDAPQNEIRVLLFAPDGTLYAGTADEMGGGGGNSLNRGLSFDLNNSSDSIASETSFETNAMQGNAQLSAAACTSSAFETQAQPPPAPSSGGSTPKPAKPGENAVYRIAADGVPREIYRGRVLVHALAWQGDRLIVGTGPEGELIEVRNNGKETTPIAKLDTGQILALLAEPGGDLLIGSGEPAAVHRLMNSYVNEGTFTSEILDTKLISRFGSVLCRSESPKETSVAIELRTGNVGEPDSTWSPWSTIPTGPDARKPDIPNGRFVQYRAILRSTDPNATPEVRSISVHYQTVNLPPDLTKIDVPDIDGDGSAKGGKLTIKWSATDPNGDELAYTISVRKEGWPDWLKLGGDGTQSEASYAWDLSAFPGGRYRVKVTASDRPSNNPSESLSRELISDEFVIDHSAPRVKLSSTPNGVKAELDDDLSRLVKASYAVDGGEWNSIYPIDGLFDSTQETLNIDLPNLKPGTHLVVVRVTDAAGNVGVGDLVK